MANTTKIVKSNETPIVLEKETVQFIIEKLQILKEIEELDLTDWLNQQTTEDRMDIAKNYIECGNLINYLKNEIE